MSKLWPSTFFCAFSTARDTMRDSIGTPSSMPRRCIRPWMRSAPKMRSRSSSSDRKKRDEPGSPWRPERPRSWLSMRRDSWRSVPRMCRPPAATTSSRSASHCADGTSRASRDNARLFAELGTDSRARQELRVAAEHDVGAAAGHVGRDRDRALAAGLRDDLGLARVLLGVEHVVAERRRPSAWPRASRTSRSRSCRRAPAARARGSP